MFGNSGEESQTTTISWLDIIALEDDVVSLPIAADPRITSDLRSLGFADDRFQEAHVIPLRTRGSVIGVLVTLHEQAANQDQLRLLQVLAAQVAAPLELVKAEVKQQ